MIVIVIIVVIIIIINNLAHKLFFYYKTDTKYYIYIYMQEIFLCAIIMNSTIAF